MDNSPFRFEYNFCEGRTSNHLELTDGRLSTEDGHSFDIHKVILARSSEYFCALFCGMGKGRQNVEIPGITGDILSDILNYIYTRNLYINKSNVCDILVAADYLLLDELVMDIRRQIPCHLSVSNCLSLFATAMRLNLSDVLRESFRFIQTHFEKIPENDDCEFSELHLEALKTILSDKNLCLGDENPVWLTIAKWVQEENVNRQSQVPDLLMHLTIRNVDEPLASRVLEHSIVAGNPFCKEITEMKSSDSINSNFAILFRYFFMHPQPTLPLYRLRQPNHLNVITHYCHETATSEIYVTYDANIDLWRKVTGCNIIPDFLVPLQSNIYAFKKFDPVVLRYDLIEKEWTEMVDFVNGMCFLVVTLDGLIYLLGRLTLINPEDVFGVSAYDPERNVFSELAPMIPCSLIYAAVTLGRYIYVFDNPPNPRHRQPMVQVYDKENDNWSLLPSPLVRRQDFAVVVYHERIFVLGGRAEHRYLKAVEVFDPLRNQWTMQKELPYAFTNPKSIVLLDNIIVYDNFVDNLNRMKTNSAVQWKDELDRWISLEESSPLNNLRDYHFSTFEDIEVIYNIKRENRDQKANFLKSPLN